MIIVQGTFQRVSKSKEQGAEIGPSIFFFGGPEDLELI